MSKSVFDDMPEGWGFSTDPSDHREEKTKERAIPEERVTPEGRSIPRGTYTPKEPVVDEHPTDSGKGSKPTGYVPTPSSKAENNSLRDKKKALKEAKKADKLKKKEEKEKIKNFKTNSENGSEHARRAKEQEKRENKHDFIILGAAIAVIVVLIIVVLIAFTTTPSQHIHSLIEQENFSTAYQQIEELYEKEKNVDSLVYAFAESCVEHGEYKRAIAVLDFLSEEGNANKEFFKNLVEAVIRHNKANRADEMLGYMYSKGGMLAEYAIEIYNENSDFFEGRGY